MWLNQYSFIFQREKKYFSSKLSQASSCDNLAWKGVLCEYLSLLCIIAKLLGFRDFMHYSSFYNRKKSQKKNLKNCGNSDIWWVSIYRSFVWSLVEFLRVLHIYWILTAFTLSLAIVRYSSLRVEKCLSVLL